MGKMADLEIQIMERLACGQSPEYIARWLEIPVSWIYEAVEKSVPDEYSPFETINS